MQFLGFQLLLCACLVLVTLANEKDRFSTISVKNSNPVNFPKGGLNIAAWNILSFDEGDLDDTDIRETILDIIRPYDVVYVQEIEDKDTAEELLDLLQDDCPACDWKDDISPSGQREFTSFIYKNARVKLVEDIDEIPSTFTIPSFDIPTGSALSDLEDLYSDLLNLQDLSTFENPYNPDPQIGYFRSRSANFNFGVIGAHFPTSRADECLEAMLDVYAIATAFTSNTRFVLYGDWNLDCNSQMSGDQVDICDSDMYDKPFVWLTNQETYTLLGRDCAKDVIIVTDDLYPHVAQVGAYDFEDSSTLTDLPSDDEDVSDHMPVWVLLADKEVRSDFDGGDGGSCNSTGSDDDDSLPGWAIALIVIAGVALLILIILIIVLILLCSKKDDKYQTNVNRSENVEGI